MFETYFYRIIYLIFILHFSIDVTGQEKNNSFSLGAVSGRLWDSTYNYAIEAASIVIYKDSVHSQSMVNYTLSDKEGRFLLQGLPLNEKLLLLISYSGYITFQKEFKLSQNTTNIEFTRIFLERNEQVLEDVIIKAIVPVRMNGDTLEFNADAFKLEKNAVVEDLMKKLPGLIIWGDGSVTINGKEVKNILVEGKPFISNNPKVATQNLPKAGVEKIQVYSDPDLINPLDSIISINIKLKEGYSKGIFGKIAQGFGTEKSFAFDGSLIGYSPTAQFGIGFASNNINKVSPNMATLLDNNTFKGTGANIKYQTDFSQKGINRSNVAGIFYQKDFIDKIDFEHNNSLKVNYFFKNEHIENNQTTKQLITTDYKTQLEQKQNSNEETNLNSHNINLDYNLVTPKNLFSFLPYFSVTDSKDLITQSASSEDDQKIQQSKSSTILTSGTDSKEYGFKWNLSRKERLEDHFVRIPKDYNLYLSFDGQERESSRNNKISFVSLLDRDQNKKIDRTYLERFNTKSSLAAFQYKNLKKLLLGYGDEKLFKINIELTDSLNLNSNKQDNLVKDFDSTLQQYLNNTYLSNKTDYKTIENNTSLVFSRIFNKKLSNRYTKNIEIKFGLKAQYFHQKNISEKKFQYLDRAFFHFLPNSTLKYTNEQYGAYRNVLSFNFLTMKVFPAPDILFPLVDSTNIYSLQYGNANLLPSTKRQFVINFQHSSFKKPNPLNFKIQFYGGVIHNYISDSILYDISGRSIHFPINVKYNKFTGLSADLYKSLAFNNFQLQFIYNSNNTFSSFLIFINQQSTVSNLFNSMNKVRLIYTHRDLLMVEISQNMNVFSSNQKEFKRKFHNLLYTSTVNISYNFNKKINLSSNFSYEQNNTSSFKKIQYSIWNANITFRFLKNNEAEIKLSALDILKQNTGIINFGTPNSVTIGEATVLKQYFMATVSYYPRFFGNKSKK